MQVSEFGGTGQGTMTNDERYRIALEVATAVLEDEQEAKAWMEERSEALGGARPIDLVQTDEGLKQVLYELAQMDYGHPV